MGFIESRMTEIANMTREEVVEQLENLGFACYDHETTDQLKTALIEHEKEEFDAYVNGVAL